MRYPTIRALTLGLVMTWTASGLLHAQTRADVATRRAIDTVNARVVRAYNGGDVATFARVYAPDATVLPANGAPIHGQPAIAQFWQGGWGAGIRNLKLTTDELDVHGASASEVGRYEFDLQPASGPAAHDRGKYIVLWKRNAQGAWQWYRDIFNSDVPAAAAPASATAAMAAMAAPGDTVWVVAYKVRPAMRAQYEGFVTRFWRTGLDYGAQHDPLVLSTFRHTRVLYPNRMNADSTYTYTFLMDPVVQGADYDIEKLLDRMLPVDRAAQEYQAFSESLATDRAEFQQFWTMKQH